MARLRQTLADYVVVAISPALIMALIGSLVFFLLEVFYHGEYQARLQYIFALFVFATVLIGRISIEEGAGHASLFALPMGLVTALAMMRFVQFQGDISPLLHVVINLGLMGLVWFAAHELTYDCTVVDETLDASGAGLLDRSTPKRTPPTSSENPLSPATAAPGFRNAQSFVDWLQATGTMFMNWFDRPRTAHVLGRWVVYFAAATLPLFGFGQLFVPAAEVGRRRYIFFLLLIYVASALGLLLTTSFLSLRRYLRQRKLEMPITMTGSWLLVGGVLLLATISIAAILPRPAAEYEVAKLPQISFGSPGQKQTSRAAQGRDGVEKQDPSAQTKHDPKADKTVSGKQGDEEDSQSKAKSDKQGEDQQGEGKQGESSNNSSEQQPPANDNKSPPAENKQQQSDQQQSSEQNSTKQDSSSSSSQPSTTPPTPPSVSLPSSLSDGVRWLVLAVLVIGSCVLAFIYRQQLLAALRQFWAELVAAWQRLFGGGRGAGRGGEAGNAAEAARRSRRLADFHDPFVTGMVHRMSAAALVEYSFAALEAWGREHQCPRDEAQTPLEYVAQVTRRSPALGAESQRLAEMYNMVAYGAATLSQRSNEHLRKLWQLMNAVPDS